MLKRETLIPQSKVTYVYINTHNGPQLQEYLYRPMWLKLLMFPFKLVGWTIALTYKFIVGFMMGFVLVGLFRSMFRIDY